MASTKKVAECAGFRILREKSARHIPDKSLLAACYGEAVWKVEDEYYCVMHAPTKDKAEEFEKAKTAKLEAKDYNFRGAWFPVEAAFTEYAFTKGTNFSYAVFNGKANFDSARFTGAADIYFIGAQFTAGVTFNAAYFSNPNTSFREAQFGGWTDFSKARFEKGTARFSDAQFNGSADFSNSRFEGKQVRFSKTQFSGGLTDFSGFTGVNTNFNKAQFSGGDVNFSCAEFSGGDTDFNKAEFSGGEVSFLGTQFSGGEAVFSNAQFTGGSADFRKVKFTGEGTLFGEAQFSEDVFFSEAQFDNRTDFNEARFSGGNTYFDKVSFGGSETKFRKSRFNGSVYFSEAIFANYINFKNAVYEGQVFFDEAVFTPTTLIDFRLARFMNLTRFIDWTIQDGAEFYFGEAIFEKPELVYFSSIENLQLHWFVDTDTRGFIYEEVNFPALVDKDPIPHALKKARRLLIRINKIDGKVKKAPLPYKRLITVLRRMADNAEENSRYEYASVDRKMAFETERLERVAARKKWYLKKLKKFKLEGADSKSFWSGLKSTFDELRGLARAYPFGVPQFLYRWLSDYGESWARALFVMLVIWSAFAVLYASPGFQIAPKDADKELSLWNFSAFAYSFLVMALQKPEPVPINAMGKILVGIETVFAPVQLALLALAIRRKFMR